MHEGLRLRHAEKGRPAHEHVRGTFLGPAVAHGWVLHKLDWYPCITHGRGIVHGELYEIKNLEVLDKVEGYPSLFNRKMTRVFLGEAEHEAWIYYWESCDAPAIETGVWDEQLADET